MTINFDGGVFFSFLLLFFAIPSAIVICAWRFAAVYVFFCHFGVINVHSFQQTKHKIENELSTFFAEESFQWEILGIYLTQLNALEMIDMRLIKTTNIDKMEIKNNLMNRMSDKSQNSFNHCNCRLVTRRPIEGTWNEEHANKKKQILRCNSSPVKKNR